MQDELIVANFDNGSGELGVVIQFDLQADSPVPRCSMAALPLEVWAPRGSFFAWAFAWAYGAPEAPIIQPANHTDSDLLNIRTAPA